MGRQPPGRVDEVGEKERSTILGGTALRTNIMLTQKHCLAANGERRKGPAEKKRITRKRKGGGGRHREGKGKVQSSKSYKRAQRVYEDRGPGSIRRLLAFYGEGRVQRKKNAHLKKSRRLEKVSEKAKKNYHLSGEETEALHRLSFC